MCTYRHAQDDGVLLVQYPVNTRFNPKEIILNIIEHFAPINTYEANKMDDKQIEKQVERWDPFHELCPVFPRSSAGGLILAGIIDYKQAFWAAVVVTAVTAVTWWFWTISL